MLRCFDLALRAGNAAAPNPRVGAVLVYAGKMIGQGYHRQFGAAHAEVDALESVLPENRSLIPESTLYVSLEPCSHYGKTPPCSERILKEGISHVVIGMKDPNPLVNGSGIQYLQSRGIKVEGPFLEEEASWINRRFLCRIENKRPYIILKWAESKDGFMASADKRPVGISSPLFQYISHRWRSEEQAILAGAGTIAHDDPSLNIRSWTGRDPQKIVWDPKGSLSDNFRVFTENVPALRLLQDESNGAEDSLYSQLCNSDLQSVLVEGGRKTLDYFIENGYWDEIRQIISDKELGAGISAPQVPSADQTSFRFDSNRCIYHFKNPIPSCF